jgi:hypothetical protein
MDSWKEFKHYYSNLFSISEGLVDLLAVDEILSLCAKGKSINAIALEVDYPPDEVREILKQYLETEGFEQDLDFDVKALYQKYKYNRYAFISCAKSLDVITSEAVFQKVFNINVLYEKIERKIEAYYGKS